MTESRTALISGCSSGLGLALARRLSAAGWRVHAGVRQAEDAKRLPEAALPVILDVTRPEQIAAAICKVEAGGRLDALVNNAGVNAIGPWEVVPDEVVRSVMEVNFFGALSLTRAALPLMRRQRGGTIVMVSSLSALVARPGDGVYSASKFALEGFAESLSYEVQHWNIRVAVANPGGYATELSRKAWRPDVAKAGGYRPLIDHLLSKADGGNGDPEDAAGAIVALLERPTGDLRYPLDDNERKVFGVLGTDKQGERKSLVREASGLGWWADGETA
jgi:NAD(P)-dependent dehydrogenase (short-subunit alcohol dehydrogenase family)